MRRRMRGPAYLGPAPNRLLFVLGPPFWIRQSMHGDYAAPLTVCRPCCGFLKP